jgi:hypothetical protein
LLAKAVAKTIKPSADADSQDVTPTKLPPLLENDSRAQPVAKTMKPSANAGSQDVTPTKLPPILENARLENVELHDVQSTTTGDIIPVAMCVAGVDLEKPLMKQQ